MDALLLITVGCFFALFVAALAVAKQVRITRVPTVDRDNRELARPRAERLSGASHPDAALSIQTLGQVRFRKSPDWRFLASGKRHGLPGREISRITMRKPPASIASYRHSVADRIDLTGDRQDHTDLHQPPTFRTASAAGSRRR